MCCSHTKSSNTESASPQSYPCVPRNPGIVQELLLWFPAGCREQERTARVAFGFPFLQGLYKLVRDGNLASFVGFWRESVLAFIADGYDSTVEVKIGPRGVHHFLLPHAGH